MKKGILRLSLSIIIVLVFVTSIDICVGVVMDKLLPQIGNSGDTGRTYFSMYKVNEPVLIIGSSRASHHYIPRIMSDSLDLPVRNIGRDGCFFSYNCCVINSILDRYTPEMIIWENGGEYLSEECRDPLENMHPYYLSNEHVHSCINSYSGFIDQLPLYSNLYRYNSIIHRILLRYIGKSNEEDDGLNGYQPLKPKKWIPKKDRDNAEQKLTKVSATKEQQFISVLTRLKTLGVKVVIVDSPVYEDSDIKTESYKRMKCICDSLNVDFYDNTNLDGFTGNIDIFNENTHMNEIGAELYTRYFIGSIKAGDNDIR